MKVKMEKVMKVIKEIVAKGITKAKEIIEEIKKHFFPSMDVNGEKITYCLGIINPCITLDKTGLFLLLIVVSIHLVSNFYCN